MRKTLRASAAALLFSAGLAVGACSVSTGQSGVGDTISSVVGTVLKGIVTAGNEVCATRANPDVELVRAVGFGAFNRRLAAHGATFEIDGIRCKVVE